MRLGASLDEKKFMYPIRFVYSDPVCFVLITCQIIHAADLEISHSEKDFLVLINQLSLQINDI